MDEPFVHHETCEICGGFAGFEESPMGDACIICDRWVCSEHVAWKTLAEIARETGKEAVTPFCTECASQPELVEEYKQRWA